jgi:hypothetical protein
MLKCVFDTFSKFIISLDDGRLSGSDMIEALRASFAANKMSAQHEGQLEDLAIALWEDAGCTDLEDDHLTPQDWANLLQSHQGLAEGLLASITSLMLPPLVKHEAPKKTPARHEKTLMPRALDHVRSRGPLYPFLAFIVAANLSLFVYRLVVYSEFRHWYGGTQVNFFFMLSRASGLCLNLNAALVLTLVLRHTLTYLRRLGFAAFLPLDNHIWLHKVVGTVIFAQAW